jgi:hypothetical protein
VDAGEEQVMAVADQDVWASHWEHAAQPPAVDVLRRALRGFAQERGMDPLVLDAVDLALLEVVEHGVLQAADHGVEARIALDAAADDEWISVWVTYGRSDLDQTVLPLATLLADRVETAPLAAGERSRVALEFALVPDAMVVGADDAASA